MRIALAQIGSVPGAFGPTVDKMVQMAEQAARSGAELVLYPATVLGGAYPVGPCEYRSYQFDLLEAIEDFALRTPIPAVVPAYVSDSAAGYTEVFLCADACACPLRRRECARPGSEYESAADAPAACSFGGVDLRFVAGELGVAPLDFECDLAVFLAPMPYCHEDDSSLGVYGMSTGMLAPLAAGAPGWFALVQGVGAYDDVVLAGGSFAATPQGVVAAACPLHEEAVCTFDVEPLSHDDGSPVDAEAPQVARVPGTLVGLPLQSISRLTDDEHTAVLYRSLMVATRDYVRKSGFADVLVGLSGGIDSALVAAIAADALGPEHVTGVLMPGPYSSAGSVDDSLDLAARLGFQTRTVSIAGLYEAACPLLSEALGTELVGLARENLQARLRGTVLMTLANARNALVLNTSNKAESGVGYSTLYGDTVGAYAPLTDIYKDMVYRLAVWRNSRGPLPVIPDAIIDKEPSAELAEDQTDAAALGAGYDVVDAVLALHVDRGADAADIVAAGYDPAVVNRILRLCANSEYKRRQEPFGPVVSLRPFVDRSWPVVFGWCDRAPERPDAGAGRAFQDAMSIIAEELPDMGDAEAFAADGPTVDEALDAMLFKTVQQEQVIGMVGDVAFSALVSGNGPDLDDLMGVPLFSKN